LAMAAGGIAPFLISEAGRAKGQAQAGIHGLQFRRAQSEPVLEDQPEPASRATQPAPQGGPVEATRRPLRGASEAAPWPAHPPASGLPRASQPERRRRPPSR
jgi:hypothetical protein